MRQIDLINQPLPLLLCNRKTKRPIVPTWSESDTQLSMLPDTTIPGQAVALIYGSTSGVMLVDLDRHTHDGVAAYIERYGEPQTARIQTPSGGIHLVYLHDQRLTGNSRGNLPPGIDIRAAGKGYGLLPPSEGYKWITPMDTEILPIPEAVIQDILAKPDAPPIRPTTSNHSTKQSGESRERRYALAALDREMQEVSQTPEGQRNERLNKAAYALSQFIASGLLSELEITDGLRQASKSCGLEDGEASKTIESGIKSGRAKPRDIPPPKSEGSHTTSGPVAPPKTTRPPVQTAGKKDEPESPPDFIGFNDPEPTEKTKRPKVDAESLVRDCIDSEGVKFNTVREEIEISGIPAADRDINELYRRYGQQISYARFERLLLSGLTPSYDPIEEWITSLPKPSGSPIEELAKTLDQIGGVPAPEVLRYWMLAAVASELYHTVPQGVLTLIGKQASYKSTWLRALCPQHLYRYYSETPIDPRNKDGLFQLVDCWIVNLEELDQLKSAKELAELKPIITAVWVNCRRPHAKRTMQYHRRAAICASCNSINPLSDQSGNRRWWIIEVDSCKPPNPTMVERAWAEAYHELIAGANPYPPAEWIQKATDCAVDYSVPIAEDEIVAKYLSHSLTYASLTEIITGLANIIPPNAIRISRERLGRALTAQGYACRRAMSGMMYAVEIIKSDGRNV